MTLRRPLVTFSAPSRFGTCVHVPIRSRLAIHLSVIVVSRRSWRARRTLKLRVKGQGNRWEHHLYRCANGVPLVDSDDALKVNWCELSVTDGQGAELYPNSFITDWPISADNVAGWGASGRVRWKIENENNNVLKNRKPPHPVTHLRSASPVPVPKTRTAVQRAPEVAVRGRDG